MHLNSSLYCTKWRRKLQGCRRGELSGCKDRSENPPIDGKVFGGLSLSLSVSPSVRLFVCLSICLSRHSSVQLFVSHLTKSLCTCRFGEPTFRPFLLLFAHIDLPSSDSFSSDWLFLFSACSHHCCRICPQVGSLISKLPST